MLVPSLALRRVFYAALCCPILLSAQDAAPAARFTFSTFTVPGATSVAVESINNSGTASGYYSDASNDVLSFLRASDGTISTYTDPLDTSVPGFTEGGQINKTGTVAGEFFHTADNTYEGYLYNSAAGTFKTYKVPGQPAATTTGLTAVNDKGNLCGFVIPPPYTVTSAFVSISGTLSVFTVNGASVNACYGINNAGTAVGYYADGAGVFHGWMRQANGTVKTIDVPGASTTPGTAPCVASPVAGTVVLGVNNTGYVSGHYWDTANNEHGFLMTPAGKFLSINVPGAYQSSGGGLNDKTVVVGHYNDSSCNSFGYVATP